MHSSLPLTAFEEYMLRDDRPSHPMNFFIRLHSRGVSIARPWGRRGNAPSGGIRC